MSFLRIASNTISSVHQRLFLFRLDLGIVEVLSILSLSSLLFFALFALSLSPLLPPLIGESLDTPKFIPIHFVYRSPANMHRLVQRIRSEPELTIHAQVLLRHAGDGPIGHGIRLAKFGHELLALRMPDCPATKSSDKRRPQLTRDKSHIKQQHNNNAIKMNNVTTLQQQCNSNATTMHNNAQHESIYTQA